MNRKPTPWRDLLDEFHERRAASPERQQEIWDELVSKLDGDPPEEEEPPPRSRRGTLVRAGLVGTAIGVGVALVLLYLGIVP